MKYDNYETFIRKYPYISFLTVNIAPAFSDILGRFVSSVENLFGTSQKTDTTAQNTLSDIPNTADSISLEDRGIQSPPTNATQIIPASTSRSIHPQTQSKATNSNKVSSDDDDNPIDIDESQSQAPVVPGDKYNLYRSFATALGIADFNEIKKTMVEKGNEMLESIRDDLYEYSSKHRHLERHEELRNALIQNKNLYQDANAEYRYLREQIRDPSNANEAMEGMEKRAGELEIIILEGQQKTQRLENLLKPYELLDRIFYWYDECSEMEAMESKLERKWDVERERTKSFKPRFDKSYALYLSMFSEGILPDDHNALFVFTKIFDVIIKVKGNLQFVSTGHGKDVIYLLQDENGQYSVSPKKF